EASATGQGDHSLDPAPEGDVGAGTTEATRHPRFGDRGWVSPPLPDRRQRKNSVDLKPLRGDLIDFNEQTSPSERRDYSMPAPLVNKWRDFQSGGARCRCASFPGGPAEPPRWPA